MLRTFEAIKRSPFFNPPPTRHPFPANSAVRFLSFAVHNFQKRGWQAVAKQTLGLLKHSTELIEGHLLHLAAADGRWPDDVDVVAFALFVFAYGLE